MWTMMRKKRRRPDIRGAIRMSEACLAGLALGAGFMYLADPDQGRQRRARIRDKTVRISRRGRDRLEAATRDLRERIQGITARFRTAFGDEPVADGVLVERVTAELRNYVSHPHAIEVTATDGVVTVSGPILPSEVQELVRRVKKLPGVSGVENDLDVYETGDVPALQNGLDAPSWAERILSREWPTALSVSVAAAGAGLWVYGFRRRGAAAYGVGTVGALLFGVALAESCARRRSEAAESEFRSAAEAARSPQWSEASQPVAGC